MAVYRIGDMLRMKREALGIAREKLCELSEEACSPQTLYRMECGKVKVKQELYRKLMECMGELPERNYASVLVSNYKALNLKTEIDVHLGFDEYEQAEKKLEELEQFLDSEYVRNKQYVLKIKSELAYYKEQISSEEHLENLWKALQYTIPSIEKIELENWPYNNEEFDIIWGIANIYSRNKQREQEEKVLLQLKESTEKKYIEEDYYVSRYTHCLVYLSQLMSIRNQHEMSMEYCRKGVEESKKQLILGSVHYLLYDLVWNTENLIQKGIIEKKERESCKGLLVQAYYLCQAQNVGHDVNVAERIKRLCERFYPDEITLL